LRPKPLLTPVMNHVWGIASFLYRPDPNLGAVTVKKKALLSYALRT
jgi:hypothetical protein